MQKSLRRYFFHTILLMFCFWNTCEYTNASFCHSEQHFSVLHLTSCYCCCLLENEWGYIFDGNYRRPPITCFSGRWTNTTESVNTDHFDGTKMESWRNGNLTHSVNRPQVPCKAHRPWFRSSVSKVPAAARSKASVCGRSPAEIVVSNPTGACLSVVLCVFR